MPSSKVAYLSVSILFLLRIGKSTSGPTDVPGKSFKLRLAEQENLMTILSSIESRLKNLDNLYTSQLTPTLETRLENFQNRISGMEMKLLRVETLLTTKLDRMSDNISSRHFRDDMVQTDLFRKIEAAYDGVTHKLAYMDRKWDSGFLKMQGKIENTSGTLERIDAATTKYDINMKPTTCIDEIRSLKTSLYSSERKLLFSLEKHTNFSLKKQEEMQDFAKNLIPGLVDKTSIAGVNAITLDTVLRKIDFQISLNNGTETSLRKLSEDLNEMLNEYASKVSDLGAQVTKSDNKIATHMNTLEKVTNSTRTEIQNGLRTLMVQIGKRTNKENEHTGDSRILSEMKEKLDSNFETIIATQNSFVESCHRLQMDEPQLEKQIGDILQNMMDKFDEINVDHYKLLKRMEGMLNKNHIQTKSINTKVKEISEQSKKDTQALNERLKETADNLETLFTLFQNSLDRYDSKVVKRIIEEKEEYMKSIEKTINLTKFQEIFDTQSTTMKSLLTLIHLRETEQNSTNSMIKTIKYNIADLRRNIQNLSAKLNANITLDIPNSIRTTNDLIEENDENLEKILNLHTTPHAHITIIDKHNEENKKYKKTLESDQKSSSNKNLYHVTMPEINSVNNKTVTNGSKCKHSNSGKNCIEVNTTSESNTGNIHIESNNSLIEDTKLQLAENDSST
ncbi:hypothetical protein HHI36_005582 [Cryptolaemus montrouzieri]|uniref:Uncharacterized protein n=1 Tax=Cryptolaemus montrouzieri TaxID=559131 RepID=A0ABD2NUH3_9CUCU